MSATIEDTDVLAPDAQRLFDLEYASEIVAQARTQLAASKMSLALFKAGLVADPSLSVEELVDAIAYHTRVIDTILAEVS